MRRTQPSSVSVACSLPTPSPPELSAGSSQSCTPRSSASRWSSRSKATKPRTPRRTSRPSRTSSKRRHSNPGWQRARNPSRRASCGWSRPRRHSDRTGSRIHKKRHSPVPIACSLPTSTLPPKQPPSALSTSFRLPTNPGTTATEARGLPTAENLAEGPESSGFFLLRACGVHLRHFTYQTHSTTSSIISWTASESLRLDSSLSQARRARQPMHRVGAGAFLEG